VPLRKTWVWVAQGGVALVVLVFVWQALARHWAELQSLEFALAWQPMALAGAVAVTFTTYALQVESWRRVLGGWEQRLPYGAAARIWCLANLGRYVPGKVWAVAGLVVLAQRAGVAPGTAAASTVVVQAVGLATAVALVAATTPAAAAPLQLGLAALVAAATLGLLASPRAAERVTKLLRLSTPWRPLPLPSVLQASMFTLGGWITHGSAFWMLAQGLGVTGLAWPTAAGVFALGYILGLLALFAPGGIGVREAALVALLTPSIGAGAAVALSVASRILLTVTEAAAVLVVLLAERRTRSRGGLG